MTISQLDALYASATAAMASADWDAAILYLMQMQARLATMPNVERTLSDSVSQKVAWNPAQINGMIDLCEKRRAAQLAAASTGGPWRTSKITYKRAT